MVFIFQFVDMVYHIDWFPYIEESLHSWNKPNLIMVYELFDVLLNSVIANKILLRSFASMFISDIGLQFSFLSLSLFGFGIRVMVAAQNEFRSVPSSAIFKKSFRRTGISSSLNVWQNAPVMPSGSGLLCFGRFFLSQLQFQCLYLGCS